MTRRPVDVDVAVVGAGPYGLSTAAHLGDAGADVAVHGRPMGLWRDHMPDGMFLKSEGFASNLSDPANELTLGNFCASSGLPYADRALPVPLATFAAYGDWFREQAGLPVSESRVVDLRRVASGFALVTDDDASVTARVVVVAAGVLPFARVPDMLATLPAEVCTHSSAHTDPRRFAGRRVLVVGGGQSALELAALFHEHGAGVDVAVRAGRVEWNRDPVPPATTPLGRLRRPPAGLCDGWDCRFYSDGGRLFHLLPARRRQELISSSFGPAGAWWLRPRVEHQVAVHVGHRVDGASVVGDHVEVTLAGPGGTRRVLAVDHVVAGTGYDPSIDALTFLDPALRSSLRRVGASPSLSRAFESSAPGLFFVGALAGVEFGPVMRFVHGTRLAATAVTRALRSRIR